MHAIGFISFGILWCQQIQWDFYLLMWVIYFTYNKLIYYWISGWSGERFSILTDNSTEFSLCNWWMRNKVWSGTYIALHIDYFVYIDDSQSFRSCCGIFWFLHISLTLRRRFSLEIFHSFLELSRSNRETCVDTWILQIDSRLAIFQWLWYHHQNRGGKSTFTPSSFQIAHKNRIPNTSYSDRSIIIENQWTF